MKYLVNFQIEAQGFSEIVDAKDKAEAVEKAKVYLENRFVELDHTHSVLPIHMKPLKLTKEMEVK
tara:strand:- start:202 stop:396 length:195 start_codon:yes stop_codon:yes gene_type:complete